jgi:O-methyltransferase
MLFKKLFSSARTAADNRTSAPVAYPLEIEAKLSAIHSRAAIRRHLDILHGDLSIAGEPFTDLYFRCMADTGTVVTPFNVFQRFQTRHDLVKYFLATHDVPGARVECGAYRGATALLLCRTARSRDSSFGGENFYLIDSFSGTSASTRHDFIPVRADDGETSMKPFFPPRTTDVKVADVRACFGEFPKARVLEGWIPAVFDSLPETPWAFVHLDLTLYEPTLAALHYFYERLSPGGALICDGSLFCPGAEQAIDAFASARDVPYVTLGHRESVFLKP